MSLEQWKDIEGFPGYQVSNHGRVRSLDRIVLTANGQRRRYKGVIFTGSSTNQKGHRKVPLGRDGKAHMQYIHHLVALAFIGPRPEGMIVAHGDGDHGNNHDWNLRYTTQVGNMDDARKHGTLMKGENHVRSILTQQQVEDIRVRLFCGQKQKDIATKYGVARTTIGSISTGRSWAADMLNRHPTIIHPKGTT